MYIMLKSSSSGEAMHKPQHWGRRGRLLLTNVVPEGNDIDTVLVVVETTVPLADGDDLGTSLVHELGIV
jgi:hypothetical protein